MCSDPATYIDIPQETVKENAAMRRSPLDEDLRRDEPRTTTARQKLKVICGT